MRQTFMANESNIERKWYVIDAEGQTLGRLSSEVAAILRGKNKVTYTPHVDTGDYVIIINASKIEFTGNKEQDKMYHRTRLGEKQGKKLFVYGGAEHPHAAQQPENYELRG